jgi:hypothetical protein
MTNPKLTPPPELVQQWIEETRSHDCIGAYPADLEQCVATRAAQWGADTELDACCEWLSNEVLCESNVHRFLRAARRPKPLSLKEQALEALEAHFAALQAGEPTYRPSYKDVIRRALEALPE